MAAANAAGGRQQRRQRQPSCTQPGSSSARQRLLAGTSWRAVLALAACLAAAAAPLQAQAGSFELDADTDKFGGPLMTPVKGELMGRTFYYEIPHKPVGVLFMAHGCVHDASDFWPPSKDCPECQGLPEEVSHTKQALARGYAAIAIDSVNREPDGRCFSYGPDKWGVKYILENWVKQYKLDHLPIFGLGVSAGASFVLKLPKITRINGIISEVLGTPAEGFHTATLLLETYPPTVFIDMQRDTAMSARIKESVTLLKQINVPADMITVDPRPVGTTFFSDRSEFITPQLSRQIVLALHKIGMLDYQGYLTQDPRYTTKPWRAELAKLVPALQPDGDGSTGLKADGSAISEQMNVAFAWHEIISDHVTACLAWLEAQGAQPIAYYERELQIKGRLSDLEPDRQEDPPLQDDAALEEAAMQVEEQLATEGIGERDNWGDMYAAYVAWLKTADPKGNLTFPYWRSSPAAGKFQVRPASSVDEEAPAGSAVGSSTDIRVPATSLEVAEAPAGSVAARSMDEDAVMKVTSEEDSDEDGDVDYDDVLTSTLDDGTGKVARHRAELMGRLPPAPVPPPRGPAPAPAAQQAGAAGGRKQGRASLQHTAL